MDEKYPIKIGITKNQWDEAVNGSGMETIKTYSFTTEDDVTKQITLAGPNVMGAMCAYCGAGPMELMNLYSYHFAKNKCPKLIFVDTQGKYTKKTIRNRWIRAKGR
jgi:hypothetical protein